MKSPYHLVDWSPWPFLAGLTTLSLTLGGVMYLHSYELGGALVLLAFGLLVSIAWSWWRDVIREGTFGGYHTLEVQHGLRMGMIWFILSEAFLFVAFFWAFFHSALSPTIELGVLWPPKGVEGFNPLELPLLNTLILLSSGATVTWAHHGLIYGNRGQTLIGLIATVSLGFLFTALQGMEYVEASIRMSDSIYGSTFYAATGLHGLHVMIGTGFLLVNENPSCGI
jgi:cytochrome c oxidase subunit 3